MVKSWVEYWNREEAMEGKAWIRQSEFIARRIREEFSFTDEDALLDIGCGRGHVVAALAPFLREAHGADTSVHCIGEARKQYAQIPNLFFHHLAPESYLEIDSLPPRGLNFILCISVLQYYKNIGEVRTLIARAKKIAAPGCRMLFADLLINYSIYKDVAGVLLGGLSAGIFFSRLREVFSGKHNLYARIRSENPVLTMSWEELEEVCAAEGARLSRIRRDLTGNLFRGHALVELPG
ncbi:MAG: methyltransferase domain-containing protein [Desulfovibrio sp.]|jgi:2-polyprenyl-3-methyl-5-hydroxy-6-metoxy-1,4-benzoquinol methylase|nr:methyltransferase domain-containing protein [Desulfovibrio sp.]